MIPKSMWKDLPNPCEKIYKYRGVVHTYAHTRIYIHTHTYTRTHVHTYTHTHAHTYIYICIYRCNPPELGHCWLFINFVGGSLREEMQLKSKEQQQTILMVFWKARPQRQQRGGYLLVLWGDRRGRLSQNDLTTIKNRWTWSNSWLLWSEDCFFYCSERNNVVVLFGTLKVQSFILTEVRDCGLLIVVTSSTFLKRKNMLKEKSS